MNIYVAFDCWLFGECEKEIWLDLVFFFPSVRPELSPKDLTSTKSNVIGNARKSGFQQITDKISFVPCHAIIHDVDDDDDDDSDGGHT